MSAPDLPPVHELFTRHVSEVEFWRAVAQTVATELRKTLQHIRIGGKIEARAKTTGSVIGKAYRKPETYRSLADFRDLAGARVLVPFASDVEPVARELHGHSDLAVVKDEIKVRRPDELRYQARHLDVELRGSFGLHVPADFGDRPVGCEVQIQTLAQSLWASVSHLVTYKRELPDDVRRRVDRLVALCEIFDDEAEGSRVLALEHIDAVGIIAEEIQRYFYGITGITHDLDQAVSLVGRLLPAIAVDERTSYPSLLERFVDNYGPRLKDLLTDRPEARQLPWLLRPEVLLILERVTNAPARLRDAWRNEFVESELDALEAAWGPTTPM